MPTQIPLCSKSGTASSISRAVRFPKSDRSSFSSQISFEGESKLVKSVKLYEKSCMANKHRHGMLVPMMLKNFARVCPLPYKEKDPHEVGPGLTLGPPCDVVSLDHATDPARGPWS